MSRYAIVFAVLALAGCSSSLVGPAVTGSQGGSATKPAAVRSGAAGAAASSAFLKGVNYAPTPVCSWPLDNPLGNNNGAIWRRDLKILRELGVNAIKVYNVNPYAEPIGNFLAAAYNGGSHPIYVIISIFFPATAPLDAGAVADLSGQYRKLARDNGASPAVIGISISAEVNSEGVRSNPTWWAGMSAIARAAKDGLRDAGHPEKLITTTMIDDGFITEREGEKYGFPVDAWGINFYRGSTFGSAFSEYAKVSKKPLIVSEWGTPESWHPNGDPYKAVEFPAGKVHILTSYIDGLAKEIYNNSKAKHGVAMGGFYFEYSDEWWKAGDPCVQLPNPNAPNPKFPGGFDDEAWFGLNRISPGTPNVLTQRPAFASLRTTWASQ
jgi:hypothetical protein